MPTITDMTVCMMGRARCTSRVIPRDPQFGALNGEAPALYSRGGCSSSKQRVQLNVLITNVRG